jgi:hypothetical protein
MVPSALQSTIDNDTRSEEDEEFSVVYAVGLAVSIHALLTMTRTPQYTDIEHGECHVHELINGHPLRLYEATQFHKATFERLHDWLLANTPLGGTRYMSSQQKVIISLVAIAKGAKVRTLCEDFQHSKNTISTLSRPCKIYIDYVLFIHYCSSEIEHFTLCFDA